MISTVWIIVETYGRVDGGKGERGACRRIGMLRLIGGLNAALPIRVGRAGSDAGWWWSGGGPVDASCVEEDAEPIVVEVAEPVAASFDLFDGQVQSFGGAVGSAGAVVVEDLGLPFGEGPSEASDFLYPVVSASGDGFVQQQSRVCWVIS